MDRVGRVWGAFLLAMHGGTIRTKQNRFSSHWIPRQVDYIKLNVNAALDPSPDYLSIYVVAWNHLGHVLYANIQCFLGRFSLT